MPKRILITEPLYMSDLSGCVSRSLNPCSLFWATSWMMPERERDRMKTFDINDLCNIWKEPLDGTPTMSMT